MSEPKLGEQYHVSTEEVQEAMEMLGKGYEHPAVVIEPPHAIMERRGNEFQEVITPAFVKISTDFKGEMAYIDEIALKVWLYIALSVNRFSGKANPGLRKISEGTGLAINTIRAALIRLENDYHLLTVDRESKKYNIYEPQAFVSANRKDPAIVSSADTVMEIENETVSNDEETVSVEPLSVSVTPKSVSVEDQSVSPRLILNQINQRNQIKPEEPEGTKIQKIASDYWQTILDQIRGDRTISQIHHNRLSEAVPVSMTDHTLIIQIDEPELYNARFSKTLERNIFHALVPGGKIVFEKG